MPQYFKTHGEALIDLGYRIVPLPPGSKGPNRKGWPKLELNGATVRKWAANGSSHDGVGVLAATTPAIDVDILDKEVAGQMLEAIEGIFEGHNLLMRTGKAPKFLIPFRSDEPFRKLTSNIYTDGTNDHKVEILGSGQQWVAYHVHPETGNPYQWYDGVGEDGIRDVERSALPALTRDDAQRVIDAFEVLAAGLVSAGRWTAKSVTRTGDVAERQADDPFAQHAEPVKDLTDIQMEELLRKLPLHDRDGWLRAGMILHHQYEGTDEGLDFWTRISEEDDKFDADDQRRVWDSFGHGSAAPETVRSLIKEFGQPDKPKPELLQPDKEFCFYRGDEYAEDFIGGPELIEDVLPAQGTGMMFGPSGSGKTFWMLDLAFRVHNGTPWRDKDVTRGDVMYIAAEAGRGIKKRIRGILNAHPDWRAPFFADMAPDLSDVEWIKTIRDAAQAAGQPAMVIVDTMSASFGGDDSSQADVAPMIRNLTSLSLALECLVVFVHHTTKEGSTWRGSGAFFADVDAVLELVPESEGKQHIAQRKHRDGEAGRTYPFKLLVTEPIGTKPNGKPITTMVVEQADYTPAAKQKKERKSRSGDFETSDNYKFARVYLHIIEEMVGLGDADIDEDDVIKAIQADPELNPMGYEDKPAKRSIQKTLHTLGEKGKIRREGRWIRICKE
jgi:AAA domain/Primase C terminal 2 (PriCT-2)/Bifunctional DNA primase/polymerase, N-terminal